MVTHVGNGLVEIEAQSKSVTLRATQHPFSPMSHFHFSKPLRENGFAHETTPARGLRQSDHTGDYRLPATDHRIVLRRRTKRVVRSLLISLLL